MTGFTICDNSDTRVHSQTHWEVAMANGRPKLRIGLYGVQLASRQLLGLIAQEAADRNHDVIFLGGKIAPFALEDSDFDVIVLSISAGAHINAPEIELLQSTNARTACVFDTPDAINRITDATLREKLDLALVPIPAEVEAAKRIGYRNAKFIAVPPHWSRYLRTRLDRREIRRKLKKTRDLQNFHPIDEADKVVLIGGGKRPKLVNNLFAAATGACREMYGDAFVLVPRMHPNEEWPKDPDERTALYSDRKRMFEGLWQVDTSNYDTIDHFLMASDLMVGSGGLTAFVYGAMERLQMIYFEDVEGLNADAMMQDVLKRVWLPIQLGVARIALGPDGLVSAIRDLASAEGAQALRANQIRFASDEFVAHARDFTERTIVNELEKQFLPELREANIRA